MLLTCAREAMSNTHQGKTSVGFAILLLILLGLNLRPLLTSIGPLTQALQAATSMPYSSFSLLTTIPIMMIGVLALFAPTVSMGDWTVNFILQRLPIGFAVKILKHFDIAKSNVNVKLFNVRYNAPRTDPPVIEFRPWWVYMHLYFFNVLKKL